MSPREVRKCHGESLLSIGLESPGNVLLKSAPPNREKLLVPCC